jgi:hypothetical protein
MADRIKNFITTNLTVKWSNLLKPDTMFGDASANHNITVVLTPEFEQSLMQIAKDNGVKKVNGTYEKDGVKTIKFKSKSHVDKGAYPCQDATGNFTDVVPFGEDVVRLKLAPVVITKGASKSMSFYLNGVQIVQKNATMEKKTNGFAPVEGGFVGTHVDAPTTSKPTEASPTPAGITDDEIPF